MNDLGILASIHNSELAIQNEVISLNFHCKGCGKFKNKRSNSKLCTSCLFGMSTKEAIKRGFIHAL